MSGSHSKLMPFPRPGADLFPGSHGRSKPAHFIPMTIPVPVRGQTWFHPYSFEIAFVVTASAVSGEAPTIGDFHPWWGAPAHVNSSMLPWSPSRSSMSSSMPTLEVSKKNERCTGKTINGTNRDRRPESNSGSADSGEFLSSGQWTKAQIGRASCRERVSLTV